MLSCYIGYISVIFFIGAISYKIAKKIICGIKVARLLKMHYVLGIVAIILVGVHVVINMRNVSVTFGTISLFLIICIFTTGICIRYFRGEERKKVVSIHSIFSILALVVIGFHIIEYYILG